MFLANTNIEVWGPSAFQTDFYYDYFILNYVVLKSFVVLKSKRKFKSMYFTVPNKRRVPNKHRGKTYSEK